MLEFHTTTTCPFCGVDYTRIWWRGKAITAIKHPRFEQDRECRGTSAVDPVQHRHSLVTDYERLAEHMDNAAYIKAQEKRKRLLRDLGLAA